MAAFSPKTARSLAPKAVVHILCLTFGIAVAISAVARQHPRPFGVLKARVRSDPPPPQTTRGKHYVNSDERRHDLFHKAIANKGGTYIGVGSHQNYVLAAWARPSAVVIVDFDQVIIDLHRLFAVVFRNTPTPEAFMAAWTRRRHKTVRRWIRTGHHSDEEKEALHETYDTYRANMHWGLTQRRERLQQVSLSTYMTDPEQFAVLKDLFARNRILFVRGDFAGRKTMRDVAQLARAARLPIGVVYLSNVEQYLRWGRGRYRQNMLGLPVAEDAVVIRTYGVGEKGAADHNYQYYVQSALRFRAWLKDRSATSVRTLLQSRTETPVQGFFHLDADPGEQQQARDSQDQSKARPHHDARDG